jgi:hypothetical protein
MSFEKSTEYIESIYNFMEVLLKKATAKKDNTLLQICRLIFNYLIQCCSENSILIRDLQKKDDFDMKPVYEYINKNNIQILDLKSILPQEIDVTNPLDIERFVLSHIYYIYANN